MLGAEIVGVDETGTRFANTDWPLRVSFPVFVLNTLAYLGDAELGGTTSVPPGQSVTLRSAAAGESLTVRTPEGKAVTLQRGGDGGFRFSDTEQLGIYVVEEADQPPRYFAVNLFDGAESNIAPRPAVQIGYDEVSGEASWEGARLELWKPLLLAVLCVLCLEWYIYNRRVYV